MMFAMVAATRQEDPDAYYGPLVLLATARTLRAIQKKWDAIAEPNTFHYIGLLTDGGLVNYYGEPMGHDSVSAVMGIKL